MIVTLKNSGKSPRGAVNTQGRVVMFSPGEVKTIHIPHMSAALGFSVVGEGATTKQAQGGKQSDPNPLEALGLGKRPTKAKLADYLTKQGVEFDETAKRDVLIELALAAGNPA